MAQSCFMMIENCHSISINDCIDDNYMIDVVNNMNNIIASITKYVNDMI
jgi:hypothetical protein